MIESEEAVIEFGRRWMAGKVSDDEYFMKVRQSATQAVGGGLRSRLTSFFSRILNRR